MANRTRKIPIQFYVNEKERDIIREKMKQLRLKTLSSYLRKVAVTDVKIGNK